MKPWIKWSLISICLLAIGIIQFVPDGRALEEAESNIAVPSVEAQ